MTMRSENIIHADEDRHKCCWCGAVRYESFMRKATKEEQTADYYFNNAQKQWVCRGVCFSKLIGKSRNFN